MMIHSSHCKHIYSITGNTHTHQLLRSLLNTQNTDLEHLIYLFRKSFGSRLGAAIP